MRISLLHAIEAGDDSRALELLAGGADVTDGPEPSAGERAWRRAIAFTHLAPPDEGSNSAVASLLLHEASQVFDRHFETHERLLKSLLLHGASANTRCSDGSTPLRLASWCGDDKAVELLLKYGGDANLPDANTGSTPLMAAATPEIANLLMDRGARVNATDTGGQTPLMYAVDSPGRPGVVRALLQRGANPSIRDSVGMAAHDYDVDHLLSHPGLRSRSRIIPVRQ